MHLTLNNIYCCKKGTVSRIESAKINLSLHKGFKTNGIIFSRNELEPRTSRLEKDWADRLLKIIFLTYCIFTVESFLWIILKQFPPHTKCWAVAYGKCLANYNTFLLRITVLQTSRTNEKSLFILSLLPKRQGNYQKTDEHFLYRLLGFQNQWTFSLRVVSILPQN